MAFETSLKAVNGGQTTMSTSLMLASSSFSPRTRSRPSATVLFIFQFPAIINFRSFFITSANLVNFSSGFAQHCHTRQNLAFQKLQARSAARAHEGDLVTQLRLVQGFHAV